VVQPFINLRVETRRASDHGVVILNEVKDPAYVLLITQTLSRDHNIIW
jgi:hypothetical protein